MFWTTSFTATPVSVRALSTGTCFRHFVSCQEEAPRGPSHQTFFPSPRNTSQDLTHLGKSFITLSLCCYLCQVIGKITFHTRGTFGMEVHFTLTRCVLRCIAQMFLELQQPWITCSMPTTCWCRTFPNSHPTLPWHSSILFTWVILQSLVLPLCSLHRAAATTRPSLSRLCSANDQTQGPQPHLIDLVLQTLLHLHDTPLDAL